jgi:hypothetical protein
MSIGGDMQETNVYPNETSKRKAPPFTFTYPSGWKIRELPKGDYFEVFLTGPLNAAGTLHAAIVAITRKGEISPPETLAHDYEQHFEHFKGFGTSAFTEGSFAGLASVELDVTYEMPLPMYSPHYTMTTIQERHIFATAEGRTYQLTYRTTQDDFDTHLPAFQHIVDSFTIQEES